MSSSRTFVRALGILLVENRATKLNYAGTLAFSRPFKASTHALRHSVEKVTTNGPSSAEVSEWIGQDEGAPLFIVYQWISQVYRQVPYLSLEHPSTS